VEVVFSVAVDLLVAGVSVVDIVAVGVEVVVSVAVDLVVVGV